MENDPACGKKATQREYVSPEGCPELFLANGNKSIRGVMCHSLPAVYWLDETACHRCLANKQRAEGNKRVYYGPHPVRSIPTCAAASVSHANSPPRSKRDCSDLKRSSASTIAADALPTRAARRRKDKLLSCLYEPRPYSRNRLFTSSSPRTPPSDATSPRNWMLSWRPQPSVLFVPTAPQDNGSRLRSMPAPRSDPFSTWRRLHKRRLKQISSRMSLRGMMILKKKRMRMRERMRFRLGHLTRGGGLRVTTLKVSRITPLGSLMIIPVHRDGSGNVQTTRYSYKKQTQADPYFFPSASFLDLNCLLYFLLSYITYPTMTNVIITKPVQISLHLTSYSPPTTPRPMGRTCIF